MKIQVLCHQCKRSYSNKYECTCGYKFCDTCAIYYDHYINTYFCIYCQKYVCKSFYLNKNKKCQKCYNNVKPKQNTKTNRTTIQEHSSRNQMVN